MIPKYANRAAFDAAVAAHTGAEVQLNDIQVKPGTQPPLLYLTREDSAVIYNPTMPRS